MVLVVVKGKEGNEEVVWRRRHHQGEVRNGEEGEEAVITRDEITAD